jgi:hypothetical protein
MQAQRVRDTFLLDRPDVGEDNVVEIRDVHDVLAHQDLSRSGILTDPCRDVDGAAEVVASLEEDGPRVLTHVGGRQARTALAGRAAQEIMDVPASEDAGLIVMGSRGMSDWDGLLIGSVAHKVLPCRASPC